jgi:REP element-mobilizing transposase RayT
MARPRKRHVQIELDLKTWGGKRKGAGRPRKGLRSSEKHQKRPRLPPGQPVHVVLRVERDLGNLRRRDMYRAIREATITALKREDFRIVHASIQGNHVHLLVEAESRTALAKGMQGFEISAARHINRAAGVRRREKRRGRVFSDRYHARILNSPRSVRNALAYVLNNWRHHLEDREGVAQHWKVDPFSTGLQFTGWKENEDSLGGFRIPPAYDGLLVWRPKTWLLREGWRRHGPISVYEVPGPAHRVE